MMCGAGLLHAARIFSFEQLLMDCEIYDMLRLVAQGFVVSEETLASETIHQQGPNSHFLTTKHTLAHMRELWQPSIIDRRSSWDDWVKNGQPEPHVRARQMAKQFLSPADHRPDQEAKREWMQARQAATRFFSSHEVEPLVSADRIGEIIAAYEKL